MSTNGLIVAIIVSCVCSYLFMLCMTVLLARYEIPMCTQRTIHTVAGLSILVNVVLVLMLWAKMLWGSIK